MKKHFAFILSFMLSATTFALVSCVNKDYDLSKPIDLEMNIGGKLEMPLKMEQDFSYKLDDLITLEENNFIKKEDNGDYKFVIQPSEGFKTNYSFGDFEFPKVDVECQSEPLNFEPELAGTTIPLPGFEIKKDSKLEIEGLDESIKKIGKIYLKDTYLDISLIPSAYEATLYFNNGIVITLPENMGYSEPQVTPNGTETIGDPYFVDNQPNVLNINSVSNFYKGFSIRCKVNYLEIEEKITSSVSIPLSFSVKFPGSFKAHINFGGTYYLKGSAKIDSFTIDKAEVVAVPELKCNNVDMNIDVPNEFKEGGAFNFELEDLCFKLTATNQTPFDFKLSTELVSYNGRGEENTRKPVGSNGSEIIVAAGSTDKNFYISESGKLGESQESQDEKIAVQGLTKLVSPIPDRFAIENIKVTGPDVDVDKAEYTTLNLGEKYSVAVNYSLETPFSFKKVSFKTEQVAALGVDLGNVGFNDLYLAASVVNTLPLDIDLDCQMLDDAGQVVENVEVLVVILDEAGNAIDYVPAGSIETPATSKLRLAFVSKDSSALTAIQQLKINIIASSPEGTVATLNANQSLLISDFVVGTESGIYINPESNKNE